MMKRLLSAFFGIAFFSAANASPIGFNLSAPLIAKDPEGLHGYRAGLTYQPESFVWKQVSVYFDASYGHWYIGGHGANRGLNSYAAAAYLRIYILKKPYFSPYFEASIGPAYLSKTRLDQQKLGMHFSFQDQVSAGAAFGNAQQFYVSITALHYSNGSLSNHNSGITVPLVLNVGYRF